MLPTTALASRYLRTARRAHAARLLAAGALVVLPAACGGSDDDAATFAADTTVENTADTTTADTVADTTQTADTTAADTTADTTVENTADTTADTGSGDASDAVPVVAGFPEGGELTIDFTYQPSSTGGRVNNPYVAVWVEDADGNLVQTISLWYEQSGEGSKWLNDLRAWYSSSGGDVEVTTSGATRSAGSYSVVWDGTDLDGNSVAAGEYVLFVEAAREHGPYEITSAPLIVDGSTFSVALADQGELSNLSATLVA